MFSKKLFTICFSSNQFFFEKKKLYTFSPKNFFLARNFVHKKTHLTRKLFPTLTFFTNIFSTNKLFRTILFQQKNFTKKSTFLHWKNVSKILLKHLTFFSDKLFSPTKLKVWQNLTQIVTELKTQIVTISKTQLGQNSKLKFWQNYKKKTYSVTNLKTQLVTKFI